MIEVTGGVRAAAEVVAWMAGRRRRYRVVGPSMQPTLVDGEFVLVDCGVRPGAGDLALASAPGPNGVPVVKRVAEVSEGPQYRMASDNPSQGTDSRHWGLLGPGSVHGRVTLNLNRPLLTLAPVPGPGSTAESGRS